ncbi:MAG: hypothetical protein ACJ8AP_14255 [Gemmatimonadales bacterium]
MRCAPWLLGSLTVAVIAGCGGDRRNNDNSAAGGNGTETGTMQGGAATRDTAMSSSDTSGMSQGMSSDTAHADAGMHEDMNRSSSTGAAATGGTGSDSAKGNQTKSGVTNTKTGKSTLGKGVTKTRPDQGQPVTSKGDTVSSGPDSTGGNQ